MLRFFRRLFRRKRKTNYATTPVVELGGVQLYAFSEPLLMPAKRMLALNDALYETSLRVAADDIDALCDLGQAAVNKGDLSELGFLFHTLRSYRDLYCNTKNMFRIANTCLVVEGEPEETLTPEWSDYKLRLFEKNEDVRAFFFATAATLLGDILQQSNNTEIAGYLQQSRVQRAEQAFSELLKLTTVGSNT